MIFYGFGVVMVLLLRLPISRRIVDVAKNSIYISLYMYPLFVVLQVIVGGLICT